jgi:hypothetical protein
MSEDGFSRRVVVSKSKKDFLGSYGRQQIQNGYQGQTKNLEK